MTTNGHIEIKLVRFVAPIGAAKGVLVKQETGETLHLSKLDAKEYMRIKSKLPAVHLTMQKLADKQNAVMDNCSEGSAEQYESLMLEMVSYTERAREWCLSLLARNQEGETKLNLNKLFGTDRVDSVLAAMDTVGEYVAAHDLSDDAKKN